MNSATVEIRRLFTESEHLDRYKLIFQFSSGNYYDSHGVKLSPGQVELEHGRQNCIIVTFLDKGGEYAGN